MGDYKLVKYLHCSNLFRDQIPHLVIYLLPANQLVMGELIEKIVNPVSSLGLLTSIAIPIRIYVIFALSGTEDMCSYIDKLLTDYFGLETWRSVKDRNNLPIFPAELNDKIISHSSRVIRNKIGLSKHKNKILEKILKTKYKSEVCNKKVAIIINRDSVYVGHGQPWRDTPIDNYIPTINYLISLGYLVIRANTIASHSSYMHDSYVDLSKSEDITSLEQIQLITEAELIIGNDTGLVGLTQMITSALTIMIDTPDIKPHPPWSNLVSVPRKFVIDNHRKAFTCNKPEDLYKKIFSSSALWTEEFELSQLPNEEKYS